MHSSDPRALKSISNPVAINPRQPHVAVMSIYKVNPLVEVFNSRPIDRDAYRATLQRNCSTADATATREELQHLLSRLERKQRLLKKMLKIKTKSQHKNLVYKGTRQIPQFRQSSPAFRDYLRNGQAMQLLLQRITELKRESDPDKLLRRLVAQEETKWSEMNPGSVWTGTHRVAPNGAVFDREAVTRAVRLKLNS